MSHITDSYRNMRHTKNILSCILLLASTGVILVCGCSYYSKDILPRSVETMETEVYFSEKSNSVALGIINNTEQPHQTETAVSHEKVLILAEKQTDYIEALLPTEEVIETRSEQPENTTEMTQEQVVSEEPIIEAQNEIVTASQGIIPIEILGNVDSSLITIASEQLNKIPNDLQQSFVDRGWHFYITDEDIGQTEFAGRYKSVIGATTAYNGGGGAGYIKVANRERAIRGAVLHEFGHYIWYSTRYSNATPAIEAMNLDLQGAKDIGMAYGLDSIIEFYAECFDFMMKKPEETMQHIPNIYAIIMEDIASL